MNKMLNNMKIGKKLFVGYALIIILAISLAISNLICLFQLNTTYNNLIEGSIQDNQLALLIGREFATARRHLVMVAYTSDMEDERQYKSALKDFDNTVDKITQLGDELIFALKNDNSIKSDTERNKRIQSIEDVLNDITMEYVSIRHKIESEILKCGDNRANMSEGLVESIAEAAASSVLIYEKLSTIITESDNVVQETVEQTAQNMYGTMIALSIFSIISILVSIASSFFVSRSIVTPISKLSAAARKITEGNLDTKIRTSSKDEIGDLSNAFGDVVDVFSLLAASINAAYAKLKEGKLEIKIDEQGFYGDYKNVVVAINNTVDHIKDGTNEAIRCAQAYAQGDFEATQKRYIGDQKFLNETFDALQTNLKSISEDLNQLIESAVEGKLNVKIDVNRYHGDWKKIANGLNKLLETVDAPISEVCSTLEFVAKGDFSVSVDGNYKGSFAQMKNAVNQTVQYSELFINEISDILVKMSNQDLDITITREYMGSFAIIKTALIQIINTFNRVIIDFEASADQVAAGARQISETSMMLSQGAIEQVNAVEETALITDSIATQTTVNAQNAEDVRVLSEEAKNRGIQSKADMENMLSSMSNIYDASTNISKIIKVIDDIAFQINLLALNAAVEAARAGVHGKGFSVVAEEVRNLAGKSKQAASETAELISHTVGIVTNGTKVANDTANSMNKMVEQITDIASLIDGISTSSKEQEMAIQQIHGSISQISGVTQSNTASAEEAASMSEELSSQAEVLKSALARFKHK